MSSMRGGIPGYRLDGAEWAVTLTTPLSPRPVASPSVLPSWKARKEAAAAERPGRGGDVTQAGMLEKKVDLRSPTASPEMGGGRGVATMKKK